MRYLPTKVNVTIAIIMLNDDADGERIARIRNVLGHHTQRSTAHRSERARRSIVSHIASSQDCQVLG